MAPISQPTSLSASRTFLSDTARALATSGVACHQLEDAMSSLAARLGVEAQFFALPTAVFAAIGPEGEQQTAFVRVDPGDVNLSRLVALDEVVQQVGDGNLSPTRGSAHIAGVISARPVFPDWMIVLASGVVSGSAARFFGGNVREVAASIGAGAVVGALYVVSAHHRRLGRVLEFAGGFLATIIALLVAIYLGPARPATITIAGLIILLPGLSLTLGVNELSTRHLVAGTARLMGALTIFVSMAFGVAVGQRLGPAAPSMELDSVVAMAPWTELVALLMSPIALAVLFRARVRDIPAVMVAGVLGFAAARMSASAFGPELGAFAGAFVVGVASRMHSRIVNRPSAVTMLPGIMLLVPGSIGFRSMTSFLEQNAVAGIQTAFSMVMIAVALVAGLLFANVVVPGRKILGE